MVVGVDKARQQHLPAVAKQRDLGVFRYKLGGRADLDDNPVTLQHRSVLSLPPIASVGRLGKDGAGADDAGGHDSPPELSGADLLRSLTLLCSAELNPCSPG